jgi:ABC-type nitrate/sulfonate/bicarbonate transport system ATPase subunit
MLTKLIVRNFKRFESIEIELGESVVLIGPNNSGKTTALQALALWDVGLRKWREKRTSDSEPEKRSGVAVNRRDLISLPVPAANLLWRNRHVREGQSVDGKRRTRNVRVEIIVQGISQESRWECGLEFDYANEESFYCRPLRLSERDNGKRMPIPEEVAGTKIAYLPPMSGLAANETRLDSGAIDVRLGEGRTAEVLRNLCFQLIGSTNGEEAWKKIQGRIAELFGVNLEEPVYLPERGEISMAYKEREGVRLDLSCSGKGLQQTLLLLAHLSANPGTVLLLDEPDAHLEILRQRQVYQMLTDSARESGSQIVAASHSEVILNEAAGRDVVVAFLGQPHRIDDRGSQLLKALKNIEFDQYYQAEQKGWVLYLEGSTDLSILRAFAKNLDHPAQCVLDRPFVHYVGNQPSKASDHFHGIREAKRDLIGFALYDRLGSPPQQQPALHQRMWERKEIENYLCSKETLLEFAEAWARRGVVGTLFEESEAARWKKLMEECIQEFVTGAAFKDPHDRWWVTTKVTDEFLDRLFAAFFRRLGLPNLLSKTNYHVLADFVSANRMDPEVSEVLDDIVEVARQAKPSPGESC